MHLEYNFQDACELHIDFSYWFKHAIGADFVQ